MTIFDEIAQFTDDITGEIVGKSVLSEVVNEYCDDVPDWAGRYRTISTLFDHTSDVMMTYDVCLQQQPDLNPNVLYFDGAMGTMVNYLKSAPGNLIKLLKKLLGFLGTAIRTGFRRVIGLIGKWFPGPSVHIPGAVRESPWLKRDFEAEYRNLFFHLEQKRDVSGFQKINGRLVIPLLAGLVGYESVKGVLYPNVSDYSEFPKTLMKLIVKLSTTVVERLISEIQSSQRTQLHHFDELNSKVSDIISGAFRSKAAATLERATPAYFNEYGSLFQNMKGNWGNMDRMASMYMFSSSTEYGKGSLTEASLVEMLLMLSSMQGDVQFEKLFIRGLVISTKNDVSESGLVIGGDNGSVLISLPENSEMLLDFMKSYRSISFSEVSNALKDAEKQFGELHELLISGTHALEVQSKSEKDSDAVDVIRCRINLLHQTTRIVKLFLDMNISMSYALKNYVQESMSMAVTLLEAGYASMVYHAAMTGYVKPGNDEIVLPPVFDIPAEKVEKASEHSVEDVVEGELISI